MLKPAVYARVWISCLEQAIRQPAAVSMYCAAEIESFNNNNNNNNISKKVER